MRGFLFGFLAVCLMASQFAKAETQCKSSVSEALHALYVQTGLAVNADTDLRYYGYDIPWISVHAHLISYYQAQGCALNEQKLRRAFNCVTIGCYVQTRAIQFR